MADAKTPYGPKSDVDYADPGYQPDGKARYPLDTEAHCRSAYAYISMPKNAAKYTADQLKRIKAKILAAGRKYGIEFDEGKVAAKFDPGQKRADDGTWTSGPAGAIRDALDAIGQGAALVEEFGDGRGAVSQRGDGSFQIHSLSGGRADMRVALADRDSVGELRDALAEGDDASGDGWSLSWGADGADLAGDFHDDAGMHLTRADADALQEALGAIESRSAGSEDLTAVSPLKAGETLAGKKKFGGVDQPIGVAVVDGPGGRTVRLAPIGWLDDSGVVGRELKNYTGGEGPSSAVLDQAAAVRLSEALSSLAADAEDRRKAIQKAADRLDADGDEAAYDAAVGPLSADRYSSADSFDVDGFFGPQREIETPWGTVVVRSYSDELGGWDLRMGVRPPGAAEGADWSLSGSRTDGSGEWARLAEDHSGELPVSELAAKDVKALARYLDGAFSGPVRAAKPVAAAELRNIELARPGTWNLSSGKLTVTDQHITDAARYANRKGARPGYVKIGHTDPRFVAADGEPALGWLHNIRREVDDRGPKLVGDIADMPDWLAAAAPKAWPDRSMEGWADYTDPDTGERYALVVDGVALLGVTPPGMSSIQSLRDLPRAVGIAAASGTRVVASMSSAPVVAVEEGAGQMDPAITRKALGLAADAPDDEVASALETAAAALRGDPAPAPVQASLFEDPAAEKPKPKAPTAPPGTVIVASSVLDEMRTTITSLNAFVEKTKRNERDEVIAAAVKAGKFFPSQRMYFTNLWDGNPEETRQLIDSLLPNTAFPVAASGYGGNVDVQDDELDREIARLSDPARKAVSRG